MEIGNIDGRLAATQPLGGQEKLSRSAAASRGAPSSGGDVVQVSDEARRLGAALSDPGPDPAREARVAELRGQVEGGTYEVEAWALARRLLGRS